MSSGAMNDAKKFGQEKEKEQGSIKRETIA